MERAASLAFPGSRTLAGWWRQLQPLQPQALGVGYAHIHRVEAQVRLRRCRRIDPLSLLLLQALSLEGHQLAGVQQRLQLPTPLLHGLYQKLADDGWILPSGEAGEPEGGQRDAERFAVGRIRNGLAPRIEAAKTPVAQRLVGEAGRTRGEADHRNEPENREAESHEVILSRGRSAPA